MICTGDSCIKKYECGRCILNLNPTFSVGHIVATLATFGSASVNSNGFCNIEFVCGSNGNYRLYEPIKTAQKTGE